MLPRQKVHALLITSEYFIIVCCLIMIIKYHHSGKEKQLWISSKILTINKEIKINNYESFPILNFDKNGGKHLYYQNYESLLTHSGKNCEADYKKCGILDTIGNIMCIPKEDECPINDVIVELKSNYDLYLSQGYQIAYFDKLDQNYALYYTNTAIDKEILVKLTFSNVIPRYITENNFIFDKAKYDSFFPKSTGYKGSGFGGGGSGGFGGGGGGGYGGGGGGGFGGGGGSGGGAGVGSGGGGFRNLADGLNLYGDKIISKYMKKKFEEEINIDKSYKKIHYNLYVGNYIGFGDINSMNNYKNIDLYESYFTVFINLTANIFCYLSIVVLLILSIYSSIRYQHKDKRNEGFDPCAVLRAKLLIIIPYLMVFIGYFCYIIYAYINFYKENKPEKLIKIKVDPFIKELLNTIYGRRIKTSLLFVIIVLFVSSLLLFLLAWILSQIFSYEYMKNLPVKIKMRMMYNLKTLK